MNLTCQIVEICYIRPLRLVLALKLICLETTIDSLIVHIKRVMLEQGPLITDGRNRFKWTGPTVGLSKFFIRVKISDQNF